MKYYWTTKENKINILNELVKIVEKDYPEFKEENTTGWDMIENAKIWLAELKSNCT